MSQLCCQRSPFHRHTAEWYRVLLATAALWLSACGDGSEHGERQLALGIEGRWIVPAAVLAEGDLQNDVEYTGAGPWLGEQSCTDGLEPGSEALRDYLLEYFPQIERIGGFACRPINGNPDQASVHSTGRALDIHIPRTTEEGADNELGDPLAHWLIRNAESIGIQLIIWDLTTWAPYRDVGNKSAAYGGAHPHDDHLHIELSVKAAALGTTWFDQDWVEPEIPECEHLPAEGGVVDEREPCAQVMGPSRFWRLEGAGHGDSLFWTNAVSAEEHSNWVRWQTKTSEAGEYEVEVYVDSSFALHSRARYQLTHGGEVSDIVLDQGTATGWTSLGSYSFAAGHGQHLSLYDNNSGEVLGDQAIVADGIRLTRLDGGGCLCSSGGQGTQSGWLVVLLALLGWRPRRKP